MRFKKNSPAFFLSHDDQLYHFIDKKGNNKNTRYI